MPILGSIALLLSLALALFNLVMGAIAQRQLSTGSRGVVAPEKLANVARYAGMTGFATVSLAVFALLWGIFTNDFALAYVVNESNRALPGMYKFAALWSGQEGSLLLWAWLLSGFSLIVRLRYKADLRLTALASTILAGIEILFLFLLNFVALPFVGVPGAVPADGFGMNPLLQYPEMVIHPPLLYLGYVGFSVPFAFALAALMLRSPGNQWISITRRWTLVSWAFLTCGIVLGMHWAYAVLGWGGYWGWDPVENASLMPWLTGTAFLHSAIMHARRGMMKMWNIWLLFFTFLLCIFGTMLTRSGIVSSVHAFGKSPLGLWFWIFLAITLLICAVTVAMRRDYLQSEGKIETLVSREASFFLNYLVLAEACLAVFIGTLFPVFSELLAGNKITFGPQFYNRALVPAGLFLLLLTSTGPLLAGRIDSPRSAGRKFVAPVIVGAVTAIALLLGGMHPFGSQGVFYAWLCFSISALVITALATEFARALLLTRRQTGKGLYASMRVLVRGNTRRYGAYLAHLGIAVMFIGFAGSAFNRSVQKELSPGQGIHLGPYHLILSGFTQTSNDNYFAVASRLDVYRGGIKRFQLAPQARLYRLSQSRETAVANHSTPLWDLYVVYEGDDQSTGQAVIHAILNPLVFWIWFGAGILIFGTLFALIPSVNTMFLPGPTGVSATVSDPLQRNVSATHESA